MKNGKLHRNYITLGVCYYPEHWSEKMWEDDLRRMKVIFCTPTATPPLWLSETYPEIRHIDYPKLVDDTLDFITFDNYPAFAFENILEPEKTNGMKDRNSSRNLTRTRSVSSVFGIMEQQTGAGGWNCRMKMQMPVPGQLRSWTMQAIAHGAEYIGYFGWRTAVFGTEIYWHGILDYDNRDNRRLRELRQTAVDVKEIQNLAGSKYFVWLSYGV